MTLATARHPRPEADLEPIGVSSAPAEKYREFLASKGLRMTRERSIIVEEIFSSHEHFDADQLIVRLARSHNKRVSRSTIYRALEKLEEAGLIRKVARQDNREIYEHDYGYPQHDHLICRRCGTLIEFHNEAINQVLDEVGAAARVPDGGASAGSIGPVRPMQPPPETRPKKLNLL